MEAKEILMVEKRVEKERKALDYLSPLGKPGMILFWVLIAHSGVNILILLKFCGLHYPLVTLILAYCVKSWLPGLLCPLSLYQPLGKFLFCPSMSVPHPYLSHIYMLVLALPPFRSVLHLG